jgi:hypothetical protein
MNIRDLTLDRGAPRCGTGPYGEPNHKFSKWEQHEEGGYMIVTRGKRVGHVEQFSREWQTRICEQCGYVDSTRRDGQA